MRKVVYPTKWGDVSIEEEDGKTVVITTELTHLEEQQVKALLENFKIAVPKELQNQKITIDKSLATVHRAMKKMLKPGKPTLTAIKLKDGHLELVNEFGQMDFEVAVTVEKPPRGCPTPTMTITDRTEMQAAGVLKEFLTPRQWLDYQQKQQLIARGGSSKKLYLITSRWNPKIDQYGRVYDLIEENRICTHNMDMPPSEEVLALVLSIQLNEDEFIGS